MPFCSIHLQYLYLFVVFVNWIYCVNCQEQPQWKFIMLVRLAQQKFINKCCLTNLYKMFLCFFFSSFLRLNESEASFHQGGRFKLLKNDSWCERFSKNGKYQMLFTSSSICIY